MASHPSTMPQIQSQPQPQASQAVQLPLHAYDYAAPHQMLPYSYMLYYNVHQQHQQHQHQAQPQPQALHPASLTQQWSEANADSVEQEQVQVHGYWNLRQPSYGALASSSACPRKCPRVGSAHQL